MVRTPPANVGDTRDAGSVLGSERACGGEDDNLLSPGKSHGQRSLAGYCTWSCKTAGHDLGTQHTAG